MNEVKLTLKDGKEYIFSDVEIGYMRRFRAAAASNDQAGVESAGLAIITRSLEQLHPEVTAEVVEMKLVSIITCDEVLQAAIRASNAGEDRPVAKN